MESSLKIENLSRPFQGLQEGQDRVLRKTPQEAPGSGLEAPGAPGVSDTKPITPLSN
jgi:hypothetical protein